MKITNETICIIEKALDIKLYDDQKQHILNNGPYWYGGRRAGKTLAYCIKLSLSDGEPLDMRKPWDFCDSDCGGENNKVWYSRWFRRFFLDIWHSLKDVGLPVREIKL